MVNHLIWRWFIALILIILCKNKLQSHSLSFNDISSIDLYIQVTSDNKYIVSYVHGLNTSHSRSPNDSKTDIDHEKSVSCDTTSSESCPNQRNDGDIVVGDVIGSIDGIPLLRTNLDKFLKQKSYSYECVDCDKQVSGKRGVNHKNDLDPLRDTIKDDLMSDQDQPECPFSRRIIEKNQALLPVVDDMYTRNGGSKLLGFLLIQPYHGQTISVQRDDSHTRSNQDKLHKQIEPTIVNKLVVNQPGDSKSAGGSQRHKETKTPDQLKSQPGNINETNKLPKEVPNDARFEAIATPDRRIPVDRTLKSRKTQDPKASLSPSQERWEEMKKKQRKPIDSTPSLSNERKQSNILAEDKFRTSSEVDSNVPHNKGNHKVSPSAISSTESKLSQDVSSEDVMNKSQTTYSSKDISASNQGERSRVPSGFIYENRNNLANHGNIRTENLAAGLQQDEGSTE